MIGTPRFGRSGFTGLVIGLCLLPLGGCVTARDRGLVASWYLVDKRPPEPDADAKGDVASLEVDDIYIAIVNRGPKERRLYGLIMNNQPLATFNAPPPPNNFYPLQPGQVLLLPTGIFAKDSNGNYSKGPPCRLPVSLAARTTDKKRTRPVRLIGTMPGALPSEWWKECGQPIAAAGTPGS